MVNHCIFPFLISFILSFLFTPLIKRIAESRNFVVQPSKDRWHKKATPILGGIAIFFGWIIPYFIFSSYSLEKLGLILTGSLIFALGLLDDLLNLKPYTKLIGQIIVAAILVAFGVTVKIVPYPAIAIPLTTLWIVGIVNSFNLLDNMDGLSCGIAALSSLLIFVYSLIVNDFKLGLLSIHLAGSTLGFLRYNFNPAQIFMGDCGSMFIGFILATITLLGSWKESTHLIMVMAVPVLVLAVPIFDTAFVTLMRGLSARSIFKGGRDHISHRMVVLGLSERNSVFALYLISLFFGGVSAIGMFVRPIITFILILLGAVVLAYFAAFLGKVKVYSENEIELLRRKNNNVVLNNIILHKRRILEVVVDFILICIAYISAYLLRFEGVLSLGNQELIFNSLPIILVIKFLVFFKFGLYRGIWRYVGISDLTNILKAVTVGSIASVIGLLFIWHFAGYSGAVFIIDWVLLFMLVSGSRILERVYKEFFDNINSNNRNGRRLLIYGAGDAGELILREIKNNRLLNYHAVGFLDDDKEKLGKRIHGVPVLGTRQDLNRIADKHKIDELLIAIPTISKHILEEIIEICTSLDIAHKKINEILPR